MGHGATLGGADVTIVTGSDLAVANALVGSSHPAASASTTTSTGPKSASKTKSKDSTTTTTVATTPNSDGGVLAAPTSATSVIPSYDPRACPTTKS
jgi:hypothetical protein